MQMPGKPCFNSVPPARRITTQPSVYVPRQGFHQSLLEGLRHPIKFYLVFVSLFQSLLLIRLFAHGIFSCLLKVSIQSLLLEGLRRLTSRKTHHLNSVPPARRITTKSLFDMGHSSVSIQSLLLEGGRRQPPIVVIDNIGNFSFSPS